MDIGLVEQKFLVLENEVIGLEFYVPTNSHSSGFNKCEIFLISEIEGSSIIYSVIEEGCEKVEITFEQLMICYPEFTFNKKSAFEGNFEIWERFYNAIIGKINLNLIAI
jgi:hypothetical protein